MLENGSISTKDNSLQNRVPRVQVLLPLPEYKVLTNGYIEPDVSTFIYLKTLIFQIVFYLFYAIFNYFMQKRSVKRSVKNNRPCLMVRAVLLFISYIPPATL